MTMVLRNCHVWLHPVQAKKTSCVSLQTQSIQGIDSYKRGLEKQHAFLEPIYALLVFKDTSSLKARQWKSGLEYKGGQRLRLDGRVALEPSLDVSFRMRNSNLFAYVLLTSVSSTPLPSTPFLKGIRL